MLLSLTDAATIAAALKHYRNNNQGEPRMRTDDVHDLATHEEEVVSLDNSGIEELLKRVQAEAHRMATNRHFFTVHWSTEVRADSPREAAQKALEIQRDPNSTATLFGVESKPYEIEMIDLAAVAEG